MVVDWVRMLPFSAMMQWPENTRSWVDSRQEAQEYT